MTQNVNCAGKKRPRSPTPLQRRRERLPVAIQDVVADQLHSGSLKATGLFGRPRLTARRCTKRCGFSPPGFLDAGAADGWVADAEAGVLVLKGAPEVREAEALSEACGNGNQRRLAKACRHLRQSKRITAFCLAS